MRTTRLATLPVPLLSLVLLGAPPAAAGRIDAPIEMGGRTFESWGDWIRSDAFRRCGTPASAEAPEEAFGTPGDCSLANTTIAPEYEPASPVILTVVFHVITNAAGTSGNVTDADILEQIEILNEDFQAIAGTNGENGTNALIQFRLATVDPLGNPTTGITRSANNTWFNDGGSYWNTLAWDPDRYVNIYTNTAGGALGYVPGLPQNAGLVGSLSDRVVALWSSVGRDAPIGPPYDQGRTVTHEVGHYLGLYHTFDNGCGTASAPGCYTSGDRICDTNSESAPVFGCPVSSSSCSSPNPYHNYMDYSDDLCMEEFTPEQVNRMRCTVANWRVDLFDAGAVAAPEIAGARDPFALHARPNPFAGGTEIAFELPRSGDAVVRVLDVAGRTVRTLASGAFAAGAQRVAWNGTDDSGARVAAGVYFYRLETADGSRTGRMVRMR